MIKITRISPDADPRSLIKKVSPHAIVRENTGDCIYSLLGE